MLRHNNGTSMEFQRLSRTTTGSHTHLISNQMEDQLMSDAPLLTQDGGNSGELKVDTLSTIRVKFLKFKTKTLTLMLKTEMFKLPTEERMNSDNNGRSSMLMNTLSQRRESSTNNSVSSLREISMLSQLYQVVDTSI
jgi:hypothetical protein